MLGSPPPSSSRAGAATRPVTRTPLFESFFLGGFECSSHVRSDGRRLDLLESTRHAELADADYARLRAIGMTACRDGAPWTFGERSDGSFDFARASSMLGAAARQQIEVIWDLLHFGWPDGVDPFAPSFPTRFGRYARAFARWISCETDARVLVTPVNEMSFLAWAGGDVRCMNPHEAARGVELKAQLVRATIEAIESIRDTCPTARFLQPEPVIQIVPPPDRPNLWARVESDNLLQYQAWDMLTGRVWPTLGGHPKYLDVLGVNFYSNNQFTPDGDTIARGDPRYRSFSEMLLEVTHRYGRPMIISETGAEGDARAPWLRYVVDESIAALDAGCPLHAATIYPIVNHAGWDDERHCHNGLWDYADEGGLREAHEPLLREIERQTPRLLEARARMLASERPAARAGEDLEA
jgi:hypothetical protein